MDIRLYDYFKKHIWHLHRLPSFNILSQSRSGIEYPIFRLKANALTDCATAAAWEYLSKSIILSGLMWRTGNHYIWMLLISINKGYVLVNSFVIRISAIICMKYCMPIWRETITNQSIIRILWVLTTMVENMLIFSSET